MHDLVIKMILDEYGIDNSENLSKALAKVLDEFSRDSRVASNLSKSINEQNRLADRMHGIVR
nr:MAG TPA: Spastin [Caudoviricetes sp.]